MPWSTTPGLTTEATRGLEGVQQRCNKILCTEAHIPLWEKVKIIDSKVPKERRYASSHKGTTNNWNKGCDPPPANSLQTVFDSWNTQQKDGNQSMCLIFSGPLPVTYYVHLHTITYFNLEISWRYVSQICPHCTPAFVASFSLQALLSSHQGSIQGRQLLHQMTRLKQLLWWG